MFQNWEFSIETGVNGKICSDDVTLHVTLSEKMDYLCKGKSERSNVFNAVEGHCR